MSGLFAELKRRNVFRVSIAYLIAGWLIVEVSSVLLPAFGAPDWVLRVVVMLLAIGFPIAVGWSWVYELTPEGIRLEKEVDRSDSITPHTGRRLDLMTIALVVLGVGFVTVQRYLPSESALPAVAEADSPAARMPVERTPESATEAASGDARESITPDGTSIAVLPFVNMSDEASNEYFSDGVSEEILNALARIPQLKVAARTSAFQFKGQNRDIAEIGRALKVGNVLEGSVRKAGNRVRITAQLIKVEDGFHVWSETFDRELTDVFAIQDEIASAIAESLQMTLNLDTESGENLTGTTSMEAYELYLKGLQSWHLREAKTLKEAERQFQAAIAIDPDFAKAHAGLAMTYTVISDYLQAPREPYRLKAIEAARAALALDPKNVEAMAALGNNLTTPDEAFDWFEKAIAINPSFATAHQWYGIILLAEFRIEEAVSGLQRAQELDPRSRIITNNLFWAYFTDNRFDEALAVLREAERFAPDYNENLEGEFVIRLVLGEWDAARAVGERLARALGKVDPVVEPYIDLFGSAEQRSRIADALIALPAKGRLDPHSPQLLYDFNMFLVMVVAGAEERAKAVLRRLLERSTSVVALGRAPEMLHDFNCRADVIAMYEGSGIPLPPGYCGTEGDDGP